MPRPTVDEKTRDRLAKVVDRKADVPASVLTFDQQLSYLLDHADDLRDRVEELEETSASGSPSGLATGTDGFGR
jgi:hypothetical protein